MIMSSNSGLAQALFVLVDKICMVAERLMDFRLPFPPPTFLGVRITMSGAEYFIRGFEDNMAAQTAADEWVELAANFGAGAVTLKAVFHVGDQAINMIYDKAKRMWIKEDFNALVEAYELSSSASLHATSIITLDKSTEDL